MSQTSMAYRNRANRQVCDLDISYRSNGKPFMYFETANTTSIGLESGSVFAMAKNRRKIKFSDPITGTITVTAQVYPSKLFELLSGGGMSNSACYAKVVTIPCTEEGKLPLIVTNGSVNVGTVFAYPEDDYGDSDCLVPCTFYNDELLGAFLLGHKYKVGFVVTRNENVRTYTFKNSAPMAEYKITMSTLNKGEDGDYTPFLMVIYRAVLNRGIELSFSSEGEPAEITLTFTVLSDRTGKFMDMVEIADPQLFQPGYVELPYFVILTDDGIGNVTMTFSNKPQGDDG